MKDHLLQAYQRFWWLGKGMNAGLMSPLASSFGLFDLAVVWFREVSNMEQQVIFWQSAKMGPKYEAEDKNRGSKLNERHDVGLILACRASSILYTAQVVL